MDGGNKRNPSRVIIWLSSCPPCPSAIAAVQKMPEKSLFIRAEQQQKLLAVFAICNEYPIADGNDEEDDDPLLSSPSVIQEEPLDCVGQEIETLRRLRRGD